MNTKNESFRVLRGGSFVDFDNLVRCAARGWSLPYYRLSGWGFRVVRDDGKSNARVLRGGSFLDFQDRCRCSARYYNSPDNRYSRWGFRIIKES